MAYPRPQDARQERVHQLDLIAERLQAETTDEGAVVTAPDAPLSEAALRVQRALLRGPLPRLAQVGERLAVPEAEHLGVAVHGEDVGGVGGSQRPDGEPRGVQRERHRRRSRRPAQPRRPPPSVLPQSTLRLSTTRTALPSERWMARGSLSFTATWMLSTL